MAGFRSAEEFWPNPKHLSLLPFNFERVGATGQVLISNMVGDFVCLSDQDFDRLIGLDVKLGDGLYARVCGPPNCGRYAEVPKAASCSSAPVSNVVLATSDAAAHFRRHVEVRTFVPILSGVPSKQ